LLDADESVPRDIRVFTANGTETRPVTSDPHLRDTDGDGLDDNTEWTNLTDPRDPDTDHDGLLDGPDLVLQPGTALYEALRARGIVQAPDSGRLLGESQAGTHPFEWDSDRPIRDGLPDGAELQGWFVTTAARGRYLVTSDPAVPDTDHDGLSDGEEQRRGCDPREGDTDADGAHDAVDADCAHDVRVRIAVDTVTLNRSLDSSGDTDLLLQVQAGGEVREHTQALRVGLNQVNFTWEVDVDDQGVWQALDVRMALDFWDRDLAGDDPSSGVQRQPIRLAGDGNSLSLAFDAFAGRWRDDALGIEGGAVRDIAGTDGSVRLRVELVLV